MMSIPSIWGRTLADVFVIFEPDFFFIKPWGIHPHLIHLTIRCYDFLSGLLIYYDDCFLFPSRIFPNIDIRLSALQLYCCSFPPPPIFFKDRILCLLYFMDSSEFLRDYISSSARPWAISFNSLECNSFGTRIVNQFKVNICFYQSQT